MQTKSIKSATAQRRSLHDLLDVEYDEHAEILRNQREDAAMALTGLLNQAGISRAELARKLDWKPSRVTRALSGNENLTLNTLTSIAEAGGMAFDIVFRPKGTCRKFQLWETKELNANVLQIHEELCQALGEVRHLHRHASANLEAAQQINRAMFRRASEMKQAALRKNTPAIVCQKLIYEDNDETIASAA